MTPVICCYCSTPLDEHSKPVREAGQLTSENAELCFACGSVTIRATDAARHCACPNYAEQEFCCLFLKYRTASISITEKNNRKY